MLWLRKYIILNKPYTYLYRTVASNEPNTPRFRAYGNGGVSSSAAPNGLERV